MTAPTNQASSTHEAVSQRVPLWRDAVVVKWMTQVTLLTLVLATLWFLASQAGDNLSARDIDIGFDFLERPPDIQLSEGIDTHPATGGRALWVGMVNTLRMAGAGIIFATLLGVVVGLSRLSNNWLIQRLGTIWVETLRNVPLLVQIIFYSSVLSTLPRVGLDTGPINGWLHISNKGLSIPRIFIADGFYQWAVVVLLGAIGARYVHKRRVHLHNETGANTSPILWALGTIVVFAIVGLFIHPAFSFIGPIMGAIAGLFDSLPVILPQVVLSAAAIFFAARWIRGFLADRRSAVGHLALSDDDYFRIIFAATAALIAVAILSMWSGFSSWLINSGTDLFEVIEDKFNADGAARPFDAMRPDIVKPGKFANYGTSGLTITIGFAAVFFGVVFYTSAFVGEIVRGGILAVWQQFLDGACDISTTDGSALVGRKVKQQPADEEWVIFPPTPISKEPLGPVYGQNDSAWADAVNWTVYATIIADEYGVNQANVDNWLSEPGEVGRLLGGDGELQTTMGLSADAFYNVIKQVGNYSDIYNSNLNPVGLVREGSANANWKEGGLIYSPPAR